MPTVDPVRTVIVDATSHEEVAMAARPTETAGTYGERSYERHFVPIIGEPIARRLIDRARPHPGERVLDVACGTGIVSRVALEVVGPEGRVVGIDANPGMIDVAREVVPDDIVWHVAPADDLPFDDGSFDLVLCSMGLQFFPDRVSALREVRRVLAPGGRTVWCTPGPTPPLFVAIDAALTNQVGPGASIFVHAVFALHDADQAAELMRVAGFEQVEIETTTVSLRLPPPAEFFWQYVSSTPLGGALAGLDGAGRAALEADVVERCAPYVDGDASVMEAGLLMAAGRPRAS